MLLVPGETEQVGKLLKQCANPRCSSGWLHLFRRTTAPVFQGGWTCSPECTEASLKDALRREFQYGPCAETQHRHRTPIGLLMLAHGWINRAQLQNALSSQQRTRQGRLGEWLMKQGATDEAHVTRALALQWSCPVLMSAPTDSDRECIMPRILIEQTDGLPLRAGSQNLLYVGFEESIDPVVTLAVQRINGQPVESGIVPTSLFRSARARLLAGTFPHVQVADAVDLSAAAHLLARAIENACPIAAQLVRVHRNAWLRMWVPGRPADSVRCEILDVVCSVDRFQLAEVSRERAD